MIQLLMKNKIHCLELQKSDTSFQTILDSPQELGIFHTRRS